MRNQLFTVVLILIFLWMGIQWIIFPGTVGSTVIQIIGIYFIIEAIIKFIPLYKQYKGRKMFKKFIKKRK